MLTHKSNTAIFGLVMLLLLTFHSFISAIPFFVFTLPALVYFGIVAYSSSQINSNYHLRVICSAPQNLKNEIAITFDDGPDSTVTPAVLNILKKHNLKASFFCIGKKIEGNENLIQRIAEEGHLLGNHTFSHSYFFDFFGTNKISKELSVTHQKIENCCGKRMKLFRPPYGVTTPNIANAVENLNLTTIGWSIRSLDTVNKDAALITERITSQLKSGSIILFHDTHSRVEQVLEETIEYCAKNGFKIVAMDKLLNLEPYA